MLGLLNTQKKLIPDLIEVMMRRYRILQSIRIMEPIGRRTLAIELRSTERAIRSQVSFLKQQHLLNISVQGIQLTEEAKELLDELEPIMKEVTGLRQLEIRLEKYLEIAKVIVVPGDSDREPWVKKEMGRVAVSVLKQVVSKNDVIAVTGGSTLAATAEAMSPEQEKQLLFVPARGGVGEEAGNQANAIAALMAQRAKGSYRLLHVPDPLSDETYRLLLEEPNVKEIVTLIRNARVVIHGIGEANKMAVRRKSSSSILEKLENEGAVAEAFGYYFNKVGEIVYKTNTVGLQLSDLNSCESVIAVAGGALKGNAIRAFMKRSTKHILITDEGAARSLLAEK